MKRKQKELEGERLHQQFRNMVLSYGTLMTGVSASVVGAIQAEISHAIIQEKQDQSPLTVSSKMAEAKDAMLEPLNSCGEQSNQICSLFLGQHDPDLSYETLTPDGTNLRHALDRNEHLLVRFEADRALTPVSLVIDHEMSTVFDISRKIDSGINLRHQLILLSKELCYVDHNHTILKLRTKDQLQSLLPDAYDLLSRGTPKRIAIDDPYLDSDLDSAEGRATYDLVQAVKDTMKGVDFGWCGTHSFTLFIPKASCKEARHPYMYQAFMGRHTLQQWFQSDKYQETAKNSLESYINKLCKLITSTHREEVKKHQMAIFTLGGADERRMLNNPLVVAAEAIKIKFKVYRVDVQLAKQNLNALQNYIDRLYPCYSQREQVNLYKNEAIQSMEKRLHELSTAHETENLATIDSEDDAERDTTLRLS